MKPLKLFSALMLVVLASVAFAPAVGATFGQTSAVFLTISLGVAMMGGGVQGLALATINPTDLAAELSKFFTVNPGLPQSWVYATDVQLNKYARTITKVKGEFHAPHAVLEHVIQGFASVWNELGSTTIRANTLTAYRQKVNFPVIPDDIEGSYLAWANEENKNLEDRSISRFVAMELEKKAIDDLDYLSINGVYNSGALGTFGNSMNGIKKILEDGIAATVAGTADNPMYLIPINALTESNMLDEVTSFEKQVPTRVRRLIKRIYMGTDKLQDYIIDSENTLGQMVTFNENKKVRTRLNGWEIVGLDKLNGSDLIFATPDDNLLRLIDIFDKPTVSQVQVLDYKVKIFMEFWLGYGFYANQLVFVSHTGTEDALHSAQTATYYPEVTSGSGA